MFHSDKAAETTPLSFLTGRKPSISPSRAREAFASLQSLLHIQCVLCIHTSHVKLQTQCGGRQADDNRGFHVLQRRKVLCHLKRMRSAERDAAMPGCVEADLNDSRRKLYNLATNP